MPSGLHVLGRRKSRDARIMATPLPPALPPLPRLSPEKLNLLARWQKDPARGEAMRSLLGKVWNAPNTAIGLGYGLLGYGVGKVTGPIRTSAWAAMRCSSPTTPLEVWGL